MSGASAADASVVAQPAGTPQRIVLDTNVWLDWLVFEDPGVSALVDEVLAGRLAPLRCPALRDELADVLSRESIGRHARRARARKGLPPAAIDAAALLARFDALATACAPPPACEPRCSDPDDQAFLELAVAERARWLVTKDRALLDLARAAHRLHGVEIVTPRDWSRARNGA